MTLDTVGMSRGLSVSLLWVFTLICTLSFAYKARQHQKIKKKFDLQDASLIATFFGLWGSYSAGTINFFLYFLRDQPLDVSTTVRLYAWGPVIASVGILFFSTAFLQSRLKWALNIIVVLLGVLALVLIYPSPSTVVDVSYPGGFMETSFKGEALLAFMAVVFLSVVSMVIIFAITAVRVKDSRTRVRSILISTGGLLFGLSGVIDLMIASSNDPILIITVRLFSVFSLLVLFSGFFYPQRLERLLVRVLSAQG